ncbi:hypothetical protein IM043_gp254 [Bacillus phage SPG24]|nr:hypothetical protein IM043_gp254 [Bacillus phage SPG24]
MGARRRNSHYQKPLLGVHDLNIALCTDFS